MKTANEEIHSPLPKPPADGQMCLQLFWITLTLSASTFGGGFVIIGMMQKKLVNQLHWLTEDEMLDMTAIAQSSPGALGVNIAIVTGYRLQRLKGALICAAGAVIPPIVIISILSLFYSQFRDNRYIAIMLQVMRAGVAAVIADVVIGLADKIIKTKSILWIGMMAAAFAATCFFRVSAVTIILICGAIGLLHALTPSKKEGKV